MQTRSLTCAVAFAVYVATPASLPAACDRNLALGAAAIASQWLDAGMAPGMATDGDPETAWNSGWSAPQWIEVDLGADKSLCGLKLIVNQTPAGQARHEIWGRTSSGESTQLEVVDRSFVMGEEVYVAIPASAPAVQFVKVLTTSSPSWVAWFEVEALESNPPPPIRVLTLDAVRSGSCPGGTDWTFVTGNAFAAVRAALLDPANFGPAGVVARSIELLPPVNALTQESLAGADIVFVSIAPTPEEVSAVDAFVRQGGGLFVFRNSAASTFAETFGAVAGGTGSGCASVSDPNSPMTAGPFGAVTGCIAPEFHSRFQDVGANGAAFLSDGAPVGVSFTHGLGHAVLICDEEWCMTTRESGCAIGSGTTTTTRLFLNAVAHLAPTQTNFGCLTVSTEFSGFTTRATTSLESTFDGLPEGEIASPVTEGSVSVSGPGLYIARPGGPADVCCFSPHLTSPLLTANGTETFDITFPGMGPTAVGFEATTNRFPPATLRVFDDAGAEISSFPVPLQPNTRGFLGITACQPIGRVRWEGVGGESEDTGIDEIRVGFVNAPQTPSNLIATLLCPPRAQLTWQDNSDDETGFEIQEEIDGSAVWTTVATPMANSTTWTSGSLPAGSHAFRIRGCAGTACSGWSSAVSVSLATPAVSEPNADTFWLTGQDTTVTVSWAGTGPCVDHLDLAASTDGERTWTTLASGVNASSGSWSGNVSVDRADTVGARVKLTAYASDGMEIGASLSPSFAVGHKGSIRLDVQRFSQSLFSPPVLFWPPVPDVLGYSVNVESDPLTSCAQDSWGVDVPAGRNWVRFDPTKWVSFPATRCKVSVQAIPAVGDPPPAVQVMSFVRFKLSDLDPHGSEGKPPVVLVHGWTSDRSTWYACDQSPLINTLTVGQTSPPLHVWALEYPNIGPIRYSAFGLRSAVSLVRSLSPTPQPARIIAHSMGGLVTRTYLEGYDLNPTVPLGNTPVPQPVTSDVVSHVVTLSSPLLGEPPDAVGTAAWFVSQGACGGCSGSRSVLDLADDGQLMELLAQSSLPTLKYLLTGGTDHTGQAGFDVAGVSMSASWGRKHSLALLASCKFSDVVVDLCSARGDCVSGHPYHPLFFSTSAEVHRRQYGLSHGRMSLPGNALNKARCGALLRSTYSGSQAQQSALLLADIRSFLSDEHLAPDPDCDDAKMKSITVHLSKPSSSSQSKVQPEPTLTTLLAASSLPGAEILFNPVDAGDSLVGPAGVTDGGGTAGFGVPAGDYVVTVTAHGYATRVDTLSLPNSTQAVMLELNLAPIANYAGPLDPRLRINGGAPASHDSLVTLSLGCGGAVEFAASEIPSFEGTTWLPVQDSAPFMFHGGPGIHEVFVKYRDGYGTESQVVSATSVLSPTSAPSLQVTSGGVAASIILDGQDTYLQTPALIGPIGVGFHRVDVVATGYSATPAPAFVFLDTMGTTTVDFQMTPSAPPTAAVWSSPAEGAFIGSGVRLSWAPSSDPDPGDLVTYTVDIAPESVAVAPGVFRTGILATAFQPAGLADSTRYIATLLAVDGHGVPQMDSSAVRRFGLDATPPYVTILFPRAGSHITAGTVTDLHLNERDWSGMSAVVAMLSRDGGSTYPDTIIAGEYRDSLAWVAPAMTSNACRIRVVAFDMAGNMATVESDSLFAIDGSVSAVPERPSGGLALAVFPTPLVGRGVLTFELPSPSRVELQVFDVAGRLLATLVDRDLDPGRHVVSWTGEDERGGRLPTGLYFLRLRAAHSQIVRRIVLLH